MDDEDLAGLVAVGDRDAFEQLYDRHSAGVLALCRQILRSNEEAEDALQHTFGVAFRELSRNERPANTRAWLYTVARNRCITMLRGRRELPTELPDSATAGLPEEVEQRADLRELVADLGRLPEDQRVALVLSQLADLDHADVAEVLGCPPERVRALVYQARSNLSGWRDARERPCRDVRTQIASARAGELRRAELRRHMQVCDDCSAFHEELVDQRRKIAVLLPAGPAILLKEGVLEAAVAAGGTAAAGSAGAAAGAAAGAGEAAGTAGAAAGAGAAGAGAAGAGGMATAIKIGAAALVLGGAGLGATGGLPGGGSEDPEPQPPAGARGSQSTQVAGGGTKERAARDRRSNRRRAVARRRSQPGAQAARAGTALGAGGGGPTPPGSAVPAAPSGSPAPGSVEAPATPVEAPPVEPPATPQAPQPPPAPTPQAPAAPQAPALPEVEAEVEADVPEPPTDELVP